MPNLDGPPYYDPALGDVAVPAAVAPLGSPPFGSFPSMRTSCIIGAPKLVTSLVDRDAIPSGLRAEGMTCFVQATLQTFQLVGGVLNANWVLISGVSGGALVVTRPYIGPLAARNTVYQDTLGNVQRAVGSAYATGRVIGLVLSVDVPAIGQAQIVLLGALSGFVGLTPGATYIEGTTAGTIVAETDTLNPAYPTASGSVVQIVGVASAANELTVTPTQFLLVL